MMFKIEYMNLKGTKEWRSWTELGEFISVKKAIDEIEDQMNYLQLDELKCINANSDEIKIYKFNNHDTFQFRLIKIETLWYVGLNDV